MEALGSVKVGETIKMTVYREGNTSDVQYELPERPLLPGDLSEGAAVKALAGSRLRKQTVCCITPASRNGQTRPPVELMTGRARQ